MVVHLFFFFLMSVFMSEHLITDNVLVVFETIYHINKKITSKHKEELDLQIYCIKQLEYHTFYYRLTIGYLSVLFDWRCST